MVELFPKHHINITHSLPYCKLIMLSTMEDENKKRNLQQDEIGAAISSKRGNLQQLVILHHHHHHHQWWVLLLFAAALGSSSASEPQLIFKLLCPQTLTGMLIGKGGSVINQLNHSTGAKIQLSQNEVYFPGTNDRVLVGKCCIDLDTQLLHHHHITLLHTLTHG